MNRSIPTLALSLVVLTGVATEAHADTVSQRFDKAAKALACPSAPKVKKINLNGHKFNMDDKVHVSDGRVYGEFSHHLSWRPDDEVTFSFPVNGDDPSNIKIEINRGGVFGWLDDLVDATIGSLFGLLHIQADDALAPLVFDMAEELAGRRWEDQAAGVVMVARGYWVINEENPSRNICDQ